MQEHTQMTHICYAPATIVFPVAPDTATLRASVPESAARLQAAHQLLFPHLSKSLSSLGLNINFSEDFSGTKLPPLLVGILFREAMEISLSGRTLAPEV